MHTTVRAFDAVYRELLAGHGLSYPQYIALMAVGEHGPLTVGDLGERLRLDSGTLSPAQADGAAGLVDRVRDRGRATGARLALAGGPGAAGSLGDVPATDRRRSGLTVPSSSPSHETLRTVTERLEATPAS